MSALPAVIIPREQSASEYEITDNAVVQIDPEHKRPNATQIQFGGYSTGGLKNENQDAFAVLQPDVSVRKYKGIVAAIADGVSSSERSQEASQLSVTDFISDYYSTPETWSVKDSAARVLNALNSWLYQHGNQGPSHSSELVTTFSSVILKSHTAHIFHAGDSRIYCFRQGSLEQLTRDHSRREANDNVVLTNALGIGTHLEVDYLQRDLEPGDIFLMTTDGVHDFLPDRELKILLGQKATSLESLAQLITNTALSKGSDDNLSCLLLEVTSLPTENPVDTPRNAANYVIPPAMETGMTIDEFQILEKLPSNTSDHLYLVSRSDDSTRFLLKAPGDEHKDNPDYLEAFIRETWISARVDHPRITKVYNRPTDTQFLYTIYEYQPSQNLRQWMHDNPQPDIGIVRGIVDQIASGLRAFQRQGMMHPDLVPENIRIDKDSRIKLVDFGTVQVNGLANIKPIGTHTPYSAPEYVSGKRGAFRSDIYALGVIAYEMLCGHKPCNQTSNPAKKIRPDQYRSIRLERDSIPMWIDAALKKATAPAPTDRYQALSELCHDLSTPNQALVDKMKNAPLIERNPLLLWKIFSLSLVVTLIWVAVQIDPI